MYQPGFQGVYLDTEDLDVDILGFEIEQPVAHVTTDQQGPSARSLHRPRDVQDHRIQHVRILSRGAPPERALVRRFP